MTTTPTPTRTEWTVWTLVNGQPVMDLFSGPDPDERDRAIARAQAAIDDPNSQVTGYSVITHGAPTPSNRPALTVWTPARRDLFVDVTEYGDPEPVLEAIPVPDGLLPDGPVSALVAAGWTHIGIWEHTEDLTGQAVWFAEVCRG